MKGIGVKPADKGFPALAMKEYMESRGAAPPTPKLGSRRRCVDEFTIQLHYPWTMKPGNR